MNVSHSDVLILGGGVIGLSCALYLRKAGLDVRVLEQGAPGSGSSHGNCGTITPSHAPPLTMPGMFGVALRSMWHADAPLYLNPRMDGERLRWMLGFLRHCSWRHFEHALRARSALLERSHRQLAQIITEHAIDCEYAVTGELYVYRTTKTLADDERHHARWLDCLGVPVQRMRGEDVEAREPALKPGVVGGLLHPQDGRLRPDRYVAGLADRVRALGGTIESGTRILSLERDRSRIVRVRTASGDFAGDCVVLALGSWSPLLARQLGLRLPMQPGKGYSLTYARSERAPRSSLVLREESVCVTAWDSGFRLGSTMEFSGYAEGLNPVRLEALRRGAARYLHPSSEGQQLRESWWGWRPMSMDEVPLIGPSTRVSNLHLATAHGMLGMSMSAGTAELVTAHITGSAPAIDAAPYAPSRFGL